MQLSRPELIRQFDLVPMATLSTPITIIGAGAIGSSAALWLAKLGMTDITVYDPDTVAIENVNCQLYGPDNVGSPKVSALSFIVKALSGLTIKTVQDKWKPDPATRGIVIMAADCMTVRSETFEAIRKSCFQVTHYIDTRMGAEQALMYVMQPFDSKDRDSYRKTLYSNENSVQAPCTAKSTGYTASLLAGWAVKAVKDIITSGNYPRVTQWSIKDSHQQIFKKEGPNGSQS